MKTKLDVIAQIRFQLDQLSAKNAHHEFEHLCRFLTQARICSNVLPATGPVSAGGDQARDFETFRTYLSGSPIADSSFVGLASDETLAFACTLQRDKVSTKIKSDLETILAGKPRPNRVYFFAAADLPVAKRHELQQEARDTHGVELEILDGQAISELLAERDVFWIAERYLSLASDLLPRVDDSDWYADALRRWKQTTDPSYSHAEYTEIRAAIRHVVSNSKNKQDLTLWLDLLERFRVNASSPVLRRRAIYEIAVSHLRGRGSMVGLEPLIRDYFAPLTTIPDPAELEDASALLMYLTMACNIGHVQLPAAEVAGWVTQLRAYLDTLLANPSAAASRRCELLETRGYVACIPLATELQKPDLASAMPWWRELVELAADARLFPLNRFSNRITEFISLVGDAAGLDELTARLDALIAERFGQIQAAEKARDRAIALYESGSLLRAIAELHASAARWLSRETLKGTVLALGLLSNWYSELGLAFAGKYCALAAGWAVLNSPDLHLKEYLWRMLIAAGECDYHVGAWASYMDAIEMGVRAEDRIGRNASYSQTHPELMRTFQNLAMLKGLSAALGSDTEAFVVKRLARFGFDVEQYFGPEITEVLGHIKAWGPEALWKNIEEQLHGPPLSDLGSVRRVRWNAQGVAWSFEWENDYNTTAVAEAFVATFQMLVAALSQVDLCIFPSDVKIMLRSYDQAAAEIRHQSIDGREWIVELPGDGTHGEAALAAAVKIYSSVSLLPDSRLMSEVHAAFEAGLSNRVFFIQPYAVIYRTFFARDFFDKSLRSSRAPPTLSVFRGMGPRSSRSIPPWSPRRRDSSYLPCFASLRPVFCPGLSRARYDSPSMTRS